MWVNGFNILNPLSISALQNQPEYQNYDGDGGGNVSLNATALHLPCELPHAHGQLARPVYHAVNAEAVEEIDQMRQHYRAYTYAVDHPIDHPLIGTVNERCQPQSRNYNQPVIDLIEVSVVQ